MMKVTKIIKHDVYPFNKGDIVYYRNKNSDFSWITTTNQQPFFYIDYNESYDYSNDLIYVCEVLKVEFEKYKDVKVNYTLKIIDSCDTNKIGTIINVKEENAALSYYQSYVLFPCRSYNNIKEDLIKEPFIKEVLNPDYYKFEEYINCVHIISPKFNMSLIISKEALTNTGYMVENNLEKNINTLKNNYKQLITTEFDLYYDKNTWLETLCYKYEFEDESLNFYVKF